MILFDVKQFEQFFKEATLKKGLRLFEKGELEFVERLPDFEFHFLVNEKDIYLEKKGDKLLNYSCSCSKNDNCEHLAAALFYFQQEALGIKVKRKNPAKKTSSPKSFRISAKEEQQRKVQYESLVKFIHGRKQDLASEEISSFLSGKSFLSFFDVYSLQLEIGLEPYLKLKKLDQEKIHKLEKEILSFIKNRKKQKPNKNELLILLAVLCGFIPLFNLRYTGDETSLFAIYKKVLNELNALYSKGLDKPGKQAWFKATLKSVEINRSLHSEAYAFMIPRYVSDTKSEKELFVLGNALKKRAYKIPYTSHVDKLLVARLQVALREWKLFKTAFPLHYEGIVVELIFAKAELYFCKNKSKAAFELLEKEYENIRTKHKIYFNDYLSYIISKARETGNTEVEIKYLRESFLLRLFILPTDLDRFISLLPADVQETEIKGLIALLKRNTNGYYFDKISLLLLRANLLDELIIEISKQNNKFQLVHEVALKRLPDYNPAFLTLYMRHLLETLRQDSVYVHQMKVFTTAKEFLDRLPKNLVIELIKKLLDQIGKTGHLYRYINEIYDYPFLMDENQ